MSTNRKPHPMYDSYSVAAIARGHAPMPFDEFCLEGDAMPGCMELPDKYNLEAQQKLDRLRAERCGPTRS